MYVFPIILVRLSFQNLDRFDKVPVRGKGSRQMSMFAKLHILSYDNMYLEDVHFEGAILLKSVIKKEIVKIATWDGDSLL